LILLQGRLSPYKLVNEISVELNEKLPLPYYFDIVHYDSLKHDGLKEHIDKYGKTFYIKGNIYTVASKP